jgi:hypothetical protein
MVISDLSFSVRYNLTGAPALVLTDTTTAAPAGIVGIFAITQPDGYTRTGNISAPDITAAGGSFSFPLTLDSSGGVQCGTYTIVYTATAPGYFSTNFTRTYVFDYVAPVLVLTEDFDVFTPLLRYVDNTSYAKAGYTSGAITRAWTAVSTPTGTITGSTSTFTIVFGGQYYDANYTIGLTSSLLYTHATYPWLTIQEIVSKSVATYAQTPPTPTQIIQDISALKVLLNNAVDTCVEYAQLKADFEYAQTLLQHILDKVKVADMSGIYTDLKDLIAVLNGNQIPTYVPTNLPIPAYDISSFFPGAVWGGIGGVLTLQTDLVAYIAAQISAGNFSASFGDGVNTVYDITHGLNSLNVQVELYENATGDTVYADIKRTSVNVVRLTLGSVATSNQYRIVIIK